MENHEIPFILLFVALILVIVIVNISVNFYDSSFVTMGYRKYLFMRKLEHEYLPWLRHYFPFYNALSDKDKMLFERRVQKFIDLKEFIPRGGIQKVTSEMKALIAGSAIQLTFGYPRIYFRHFDRILIYPDDYYSTITRQYHKGEVNLGGLIVVSWTNLKEGFNNPSDGFHLGLHEMAHALRLINIIDNEEYDFYDRQTITAFDKEAHIEIQKIRTAPENAYLFRNYGATNINEFFAVAVEVFFEKSQEFRDYNPKLYALLSTILKIDPLTIHRSV